MAANVAEWTGTPADILPGPGYVVKGGSFARDPMDASGDDLRADLTRPQAGNEAKLDLGFRCARSDEQP